MVAVRLHCVLIAFICFWSIVTGKDLPTKVKVVPAARIKEVLDIIPYESHTKLIFHVDLPAYEKRTVLDPIGATHMECKGDDIVCNNRILTTLIMEDYVARVDEAIEESRTRPKRQLGVLIGAGIAAAGGGYLLHSAKSLFTSSLFGNQGDIESYVFKLRASVQENQRSILVAEANVTKFADDVSKAIEGMRNEIFNMVYNRKLEKMELVTLQKFLFTQIERDWFSSSYLSCTQRTLPAKMVPTSVLQAELKKLKASLELQGKTLAIGTDHIYSYLKLPIVDCFFSKEKATVVVNVPIYRTAANWRVFEIFHTKFAYNNQVCDLYPQDSKFLAVGGENAVLIDHHMSQHCTMSEDKLCLIPQFTRDSSQSLHCAIGMLYNKPVVELSKVCAFRCSTNSEIIVNQLDEYTLVITNVEEMNISCPGKLETYKFNKTGSVEVHMRCNCTMYLDGKMKIDPPFFCLREEFNAEYVFRTTPNLWSTLEHAIASSSQYFNEHTNYTYNPLWPYTVPVLNLTPPRNPLAEEAVGYSLATIDRIWLICLTVLMVIVIGCVVFIMVNPL